MKGSVKRRQQIKQDGFYFIGTEWDSASIQGRSGFRAGHSRSNLQVFGQLASNACRFALVLSWFVDNTCAQISSATLPTPFTRVFAVGSLRSTSLDAQPDPVSIKG